MHITRVTTKDGRTVEGYVWTVRPAEGWFALACGDDRVRFEFDECESVVTKNERVSAKQVGVDVDELARWREYAATSLSG